MAEKLDLLDRKILYELDINSRQSLNELARKLQRNRNVIEYRIKRLEEKGIIRNFVTLLDAGRLGLMIWNVYVEFQNLTREMENEIRSTLSPGAGVRRARPRCLRHAAHPSTHVRSTFGRALTYTGASG